LIKVFGVPTCDKIKKTHSLLSSYEIPFEFVNLRKNALSKTKLQNIVEQLGLETVLNRKGMLFRKLGLKEKDLSDEQLFEELFNEQGMIKRPLIEKDNTFMCGYDQNKILSFVK